MTDSHSDDRSEREAPEALAEEDVTAYRAALDSAVRSLAGREHSRRELERKLVGKGHDRQLVERVMDYVAGHDLQSDERFAEGFVRARIQKGYGPVKIRQELGQRGVSEQVLDDQLTNPAEFWVEVAESAVRKRYRAAPESREDWNTQARFLARRGFPADLIYRILGEV